MNNLRILIGLLTPALLSGCVDQEATPVRSAADTAILLASTSHVWMADFDGDKGSLAYFVPETDELVISLECIKSTGRATVSALTEQPPGPGTLVLWDGDRTREWAAVVEWDDVMGGSLAVAEIGLHEAALTPLRRGTGLRIGRPAIGPLAVASEPEQREVERFFAFCDR
ncbi:hypothetical protein [Brevundimonas sp.]|uniref:hypothetical protein n=1 Tax=Brevundimonas sp. TaxID=1871086 RepID=UPI002ABA8094|nr:hypothetical protein [Brevundimonas sp.]MDZ4363058.1 hypothetical protein [Brevundimonas sp.]